MLHESSQVLVHPYKQKLLVLLFIELLLFILALWNAKMTGLIVGGMTVLILLYYYFDKYPFYIIPFILFSILAGNISAIPLGRKLPNIYFIDIEIVLIFMFFFFKLLMQSNNLTFSLTKFEKFFLLYLISCILANFGSVDVLRGFAYFRGYLFCFLLFVFSLKYIDTFEKIEKLFWMFMIWGIFLSLIIIHHVFSQGNLLITIATKNIHLNWGSSNYLAAFYVLIIPMGISVLFTKTLPVVQKTILITSIIIMISALFLTASRGGVVALAAGIFFLLFRYRNWKAFTAFLFFIIIVGIVIYLNPSAKFIWEGLAGFQSSSSVFSRIGTWYEAIRIIKEHPVFGVGLGNMHYFVQNYYIKLTGNFELLKAHNLFLELLVETGFLGFVFYNILLYNVYKIILKNNNRFNNPFHHSLAWGIFAGISATLVHSLVEPTILSYSFGLFFWTVVVIALKQAEFTTDIEQTNRN
ncbi:MAG TPA: O-antigen ligase family protein [bacterium]|nr:O-antigen ligase family protein [bacterium]HPN45812.1 O-antigen ligase family protein [bacterium]